MDAMILAAGLGTRLRPLTEQMPKALVDVAGVPMLERVARRLVDAGATRLIVNVHHHAGQVVEFIASRNSFGVETLVSDETGALLETGGGLLHARPHFALDAPFILHNVDIVTDIDPAELYRAHTASGRLATLAAMDRETTRYLLFDSTGSLCGYGNAARDFEYRAREPAGATLRLGFAGIHVIEPRIFELITERGAFSIIDLYMRLGGSGESIGYHRVDGSSWIDIGSFEKLGAARKLADAEDFGGGR